MSKVDKVICGRVGIWTKEFGFASEPMVLAVMLHYTTEAGTWQVLFASRTIVVINIYIITIQPMHVLACVYASHQVAL